jgi:hypothetical protein
MALEISRLLENLTFEEQADIILSFRKWLILDYMVNVENGTVPIPYGGIESIRELDLGLEDRLRRMVENKDSRSLKVGVLELLRLLPVAQEQSNGPRLNQFLSEHLPEHVFCAVYRAVGLDPEDLRFTRVFPTGPVR